MTSIPSVSARRTAVEDMRPPLIRLLVDLWLSNPSGPRRWFLVPDAISPVTPLGPVNGAGIRLLAGSGRVTLAHFEGQGGFYALLLDSGARVQLRDLWLDADAEHGGRTLTVVTAAEVVVGDTPAEAWYDVDPLCDREAAVSAMDGVLISERWPEGNPELEVVVREAIDLTAALDPTSA